MKRSPSLCSTTILFVLVAFLGVGCKESTAISPTGTRLTLKKPPDQTVQRGKTSDVVISIERKGFDAPVRLFFDQLPRGVSVTSADQTIPAGKTWVTMTLFAAPDADLVGNHAAKVTAKESSDLQTSETFLVTVKE